MCEFYSFDIKFPNAYAFTICCRKCFKFKAKSSKGQDIKFHARIILLHFINIISHRQFIYLGVLWSVLDKRAFSSLLIAARRVFELSVLWFVPSNTCSAEQGNAIAGK